MLDLYTACFVTHRGEASFQVTCITSLSLTSFLSDLPFSLTRTQNAPLAAAIARAIRQPAVRSELQAAQLVKTAVAFVIAGHEPPLPFIAMLQNTAIHEVSQRCRAGAHHGCTRSYSLMLLHFKRQHLGGPTPVLYLLSSELLIECLALLDQLA